MASIHFFNDNVWEEWALFMWGREKLQISMLPKTGNWLAKISAFTVHDQICMPKSYDRGGSFFEFQNNVTVSVAL